jgi:ABC-type amino acid transport substrate-binding protein
MRKIELAATLLIGVALLAATPSMAMDEIRERGVLRVAVYQDFPPYSFRDGAVYRGTDVDLARAIAERMGLAVEVRAVGADENMEDDLRNNIWKGHYMGGGTADIMMHVPFDPAFAEENDRTIIFAPYFREQMAIAFDPARVSHVRDPGQLAQIRIGVEVDTVADYFLSGAYGGALTRSAVRVKNLDEALDAMAAGTLDAAMASRAQLEGGLKRRNVDRFQVHPFLLRGMLRSAWDIGIAAKVENEELVAEVSQAIDALQREGVLAKVLSDYGVGNSTPEHVITSRARN